MIGLKIIVICYVLYVFEVKDNLVIAYFLYVRENKGYMFL